jgi:perosamine synthetase
MGALDKEGIDSRPMFYPLSSLSAYDGVFQSAIARDRNEVSYRITPWGINLPSALCLKKGQVQRVVDALIQILSAP